MSNLNKINHENYLPQKERLKTILNLAKDEKRSNGINSSDYIIKDKNKAETPKNNGSNGYQPLKSTVDGSDGWNRNITSGSNIKIDELGEE